MGKTYKDNKGRNKKYVDRVTWENIEEILQGIKDKQVSNEEQVSEEEIAVLEGEQVQ
jgi:hypothetical protein